MSYEITPYDLYAAAALTGFLSKGLGSETAALLAKETAIKMVRSRPMDGRPSRD